MFLTDVSVNINCKYVNFKPREFVSYIVMVSYDQPNTYAEVPCRHKLENSLPRKRADCYFIRKADLKVLSTPTMVGNGAIVSVDSLELSWIR